MSSKVSYSSKWRNYKWFYQGPPLSMKNIYFFCCLWRENITSRIFRDHSDFLIWPFKVCFKARCLATRKHCSFVMKIFMENPSEADFYRYFMAWEKIELKDWTTTWARRVFPLRLCSTLSTTSRLILKALWTCLEGNIQGNWSWSHCSCHRTSNAVVPKLFFQPFPCSQFKYPCLPLHV